MKLNPNKYYLVHGSPSFNECFVISEHHSKEAADKARIDLMHSVRKVNARPYHCLRVIAP